MSAVRNVAREKLEQGQLALGVGIRMTRSVEIAKAMAVAGFITGCARCQPAKRHRRSTPPT